MLLEKTRFFYFLEVTEESDHEDDFYVESGVGSGFGEGYRGEQGYENEKQLSILVDMGWKLWKFVKPSLSYSTSNTGCNIKHRIKFSTNLLSPGWFPLMSGITSVAPRLLATITGYYQQTQSEIEKLGLVRKIKKGEGKLTVSTIAQSVSLAQSLSLHRSIALAQMLTVHCSITFQMLYYSITFQMLHCQSRSKCFTAQSRSKCSNASLLSCSLKCLSF